MIKFRNILKDLFSASKRKWYFLTVITCFILTICVILPIVLKKDISDGLIVLEQAPIFEDKEMNEDIIFENPQGYDSTVPYKITVIDKFGNALKGLAVRVEYVSGEAGLYDADYRFTNKNGEVILNVLPKAIYTLFVQQISCISYTDKIPSDVLRQISLNIEIKNADSITVIWDKTLYTEVTPENTKLLIKVFDEYYSPIPNLTVSILTIDDGSYADIGFTDESGVVYWYNFNEGEYYIRLKSGDNAKTFYYKINLTQKDNIIKLLWE